MESKKVSTDVFSRKKQKKRCGTGRIKDESKDFAMQNMPCFL